MALLLPASRRSRSTRTLYGLIYLLLTAGAAVMVLPFLLMLSGSTKSAVDSRTFDLLPRFLRDDLALYRKHAEGLFNESLDLINMTYGLEAPAFDKLTPPAPARRALAQTWLDFLRAVPLPACAGECGYVFAPVSKTNPRLLREFRDELRRRYRDRVDEMNAEMETDFLGWSSFLLVPQNYLARFTHPADSPFQRAFQEFARRQPEGLKYVYSVEGFYRAAFLRNRYGGDIREYNRRHGTAHAAYDRIRLSPTFPAQGHPLEQQDWEEFVRHSLGLVWIRAAPEARLPYQRFLKAKYLHIEALNRDYAAAYPSFEDVPLPATAPAGGLALSDWAAFISGWTDPVRGTLHIAPAAALRVESIEERFRAYARERFGSLAEANRRWHTGFADFADVPLPQRDAHYLYFLEQRGPLRAEFVTRNYRTVLDYVLVHGRGVANTLLYCGLAVLAALVANPLAAYALSRYRPPRTYSLLLFLMLTMAFPPMVTQIPLFLMLRHLNLLNTLAALVLPGLANGYSIFLLKGFFDSLPREIYESAQIDGAGEWTLFWEFTLKLSLPILAVIGLHAFAAAYANFMFALLLCQDEKMWTLMVWLYELQQRSGPAVMYASLIIAALPTFVVFVFCQKLILRGIVVPVEK